MQDYPSSLVLGRPARRFAWPHWSIFLIPGLVGLVAYLVVVPLALLIIGGFIRGGPGTFSRLTFANYVRAYGSSALPELFYNSFVFAAGSVLLALPVAVLFAWLIERTNTPLRTVAYALVIAPVAMPGMLLSMSWVLLLSPNVGIINKATMFILGLENAPFNIYSLGGMIFTEGLRLVPTTFLLLVGAFRAMDPFFRRSRAGVGRDKMGHHDAHSTAHHVPGDSYGEHLCLHDCHREFRDSGSARLAQWYPRV